MEPTEDTFHPPLPEEGAKEPETGRSLMGGMTLREYYAGQALAGLMASQDGLANATRIAKEEGMPPVDAFAVICCDFADALIERTTK